MNILYISYDGATDLVSRSQVLPYLKGMSDRGWRVTFLSFEKSMGSGEGADVRPEELKDGRIRWVPRRYHKVPTIPATVYDILQGVSAGSGVIKNGHIDVIHVRGYIAACIGFILKSMFGVKIVFDMRGFWADEKVDAGSWKEGGAMHRLFKRFEKFFIAHADEIVVLTEAAKREILESHPARTGITVIPCCVDIGLFARAFSVARQPVDAARRVVLYVGNLGSFYNLDGILDFFGFLKEMDRSFFLRIVSGYGKELVIQRAISRNIGVSDYSIEKLSYDRMPAAFSPAEASLIFYNRKLSGKGCCPIKFTESLASGVPVIINSGIGDCDEIVTANRVGAVIPGYSRGDYERAFGIMAGLAGEKDALKKRCRDVAAKLFSLDRGIERYEDIYERLAGVRRA